MRANLTNTYVERLPFTDNGTVWHFDISLGGLQLAVGKRTQTFYCEATHGGKKRRVKQGGAKKIRAPRPARRAGRHRRWITSG